MHRLKLLQAAVVVAVPLVALGCGPQRADTRETYTEPSPAMNAPAPGGAAGMLGLGSQVGEDGRLASHSDTFKRGEPIIAAVDAATLKPGSSVRLAWRGPQGQTVASEETAVPPDARTITFKAQDTTSWTPGQYRVETSAGTTVLGTRTFTVE